MPLLLIPPYTKGRFCCFSQESLALSQNQFEDLLFLQRVYVLKRHELCEKRAGLTDQIQNGSQNFLVDVSKMSGIATELKQNASSALQLAKKFCWALYFGVSFSALFCVKQGLLCDITVQLRLLSIMQTSFSRTQCFSVRTLMSFLSISCITDPST